jgi:flagellin
MGLTLNTNISSLIAQNALNTNSTALSTSLQRLSTGLKINSGADGPAALVISEEQKGQIAGLQTAIDNSSKASSLVQTAEGALSTINELLTQIRSIAIDSANNGIQDANALAANQAQITNALDTIDRIANNTQFGTKRLLDGSAGIAASTSSPGVSVAGTAGSAAPAGTYNVNVTTAAVKANVTGGAYVAPAAGSAGNANLTINSVNIVLTSNNAGTLQNAINTINSYSGSTGVVASQDATGTKLVLAAGNYGAGGNFTVTADANAVTATGFAAGPTTTANGQDAIATITDPSANAVSFTGVGNAVTGDGLVVTLGASSTTAFTSVSPAAAKVNVTNNTLVFQIGANAGQTAAIGINNVRTTSLGQNTSGVTTGVSSLNGIDVTTAVGSQDAIRVIDNAAGAVSNLRGALGAFQSNTLQQTANNLTITLTNTQSAESVIRDTNFAQETAIYTKNQVLLQVGTSVLANSNALNQLVLGLFK